MRSVIVLLLAVYVANAWTEERTNPFANPDLAVPQTSESKTLAPPELRLKAVLPGTEHAFANINGTLLRLGDTYLGYVLTNVTSESVMLKKNDQLILLELRPTGRWLAGDPS